MTPSRNVPPSLKPTIQRRNAIEFAVPRVEPDDTTKLVAAVTERIVISPVATVAFLNGTFTGLIADGSFPLMPFRLMVSALAAAAVANATFSGIPVGLLATF